MRASAAVQPARAHCCTPRGPRRKRQDWRAWPGRVVVDWLGLAWISTVILGVPVLTAAMGAQYAKLGIIAGISSFIFQLPVRCAWSRCCGVLRPQHLL
jgi:hypothetical protein